MYLVWHKICFPQVTLLRIYNFMLYKPKVLLDLEVETSTSLYTASLFFLRPMWPSPSTEGRVSPGDRPRWKMGHTQSTPPGLLQLSWAERHQHQMVGHVSSRAALPLWANGWVWWAFAVGLDEAEQWSPYSYRGTLHTHHSQLLGTQIVIASLGFFTLQIGCWRLLLGSVITGSMAEA